MFPKRDLIYEKVVAVIIALSLHLVALAFLLFESSFKGAGGSGLLDRDGGMVVSVNFLNVHEDDWRVSADGAPLDSEGDIFQIDTAEHALNAPGERANNFNSMGSGMPSADEDADADGVRSEFEEKLESYDSSSMEFSEEVAISSGRDDLLAEYLLEVSSKIYKNWNYEGPRSGCKLIIRQSLGGEVEGSTTVDCILPMDARRSLEAAALMAQPLPYAGFEAVFSEEISIQIEEF